MAKIPGNADLKRRWPGTRIYKYEGKDTGDDTQTEQDYFPVAVQVQRFIDAGELLEMQKHSLFDGGWDENFHLNDIAVPPERRKGFDRVEAQEELEEANERIQTRKAQKDAEDQTNPGS